MAHLRSTVWRPAEFVRLPPRWLVGEGLLAGLTVPIVLREMGTVPLGTDDMGAWRYVHTSRDNLCSR